MTTTKKAPIKQLTITKPLNEGFYGSILIRVMLNDCFATPPLLSSATTCTVVTSLTFYRGSAGSGIPEKV